MRTTSANKDGIIKRSYDGQDLIQYIHNMPRKVVYGQSLSGDAVMPDVLVKLLLFNQVSDLAAYLKTGAFPAAKYWKHILNTVDERDMGSMIQVTDAGRYYDAVLHFSGRPWAARWKRLLKLGATPPEVNRAKIKIKRFDYIGHSDGQSFYLDYGWANKKGELPNKEVIAMYTDEVLDALPKSAVTGDAFAYLWGCNLGEQMGPSLTVPFKEVVACETSTYFDHILDSDAAMPVPGPGHHWKTFKRK